MALISLAVCIAGGLFYLFSANPKRARLGEISFAIGLLIFLWIDAPKILALFGRG